jgi:hypothetical protein
MAMILEPSRLRLTQAIYFGKPPGSVPILTGYVKRDGTTPLTADWTAGAFRITSKNSFNVYNAVTGYGLSTIGSAAGNSTALQNANNAAAAAGGGIVYVQAGNYDINSVTLSPYVTLMGDGMFATTLTGKAAAAMITIDGTGSNNVYNSIRELNLIGFPPVTQCLRIKNGVFVDIHRVRMSSGTSEAALVENTAGQNTYHVQFRQCWITQGLAQPCLHLTGVAVTGVVIIDTEISGGTPGILIDTTSNCNVQMFGDIIEGNAGPGIVIEGSAIAGTAGLVLNVTDCNFESNVTADIDINPSAAAIGPNVSIKGGSMVGTTARGIRMNPKTNLLEVMGLVTAGHGTADIDLGDLSTTTASINIQGNNLTGTPAILSTNPVISGSNYIGHPTAATGALAFYSGLNNSTSLDLLNHVAVFQDRGSGNFPCLVDNSGSGNTSYALSIGGVIKGAVSYSRASNYLGLTNLAYSGADFSVKLDSAGAMIFQDSASSTPRVQFNAGGNVGFGTTTPSRTFDLNGVQRYRGQAAPAVSEPNSGTIYFDSATNKLKASLNGSAYTDVIGSGGVTGSGTAGQVAYWDGVTSLASPSGIYVDAINNRLGINVPVPGYSLDVDGVVNLPLNAEIYSGGQPIFHVSSGDGRLMIGGNNSIPVANNTAVGVSALSNDVGVGLNSAFGLSAGVNINGGTRNVAIGSNALNPTTTGNDNTAVGESAGFTNTTGSNNIFIGSAADASVGNLNHAAAIGTGAVVADSNSLVIGGGLQKVGITISTPKVALDVGGMVSLRQQPVTLVNGLNSDIQPLLAASFLRIDGPTGGFSVGGFKMPVADVSDGMVLTIYNSMPQQMTIVNEDLASTAINRIWTLTGGNVVLRAGTSSATFHYDITDDRWILTSSN